MVGEKSSGVVGEEVSGGADLDSEKPILKIIGKDGNAFNILGLAQRAMKKAGWVKEKRDIVMNEMTSGDYDHLLQVAMKYFEVE